MQRLSICKSTLLFLLMGLLFAGCGQKEAYLPEAKNDYMVTMIGE